MKKVLMVAAIAAALAASVGVSSGRALGSAAARIPWAGTWASPETLSIGMWDSSQTVWTDSLVNLGCPFVPHESETEAQTSNLTAAYSGWVRPNPNNNTAKYNVRTSLVGSLEDASSNTYMVSGSFLDKTLHYDFGGDLYFQGVGRVRFSGLAGTAVGRAKLVVTHAPMDYTLSFSKITKCTIS